MFSQLFLTLMDNTFIRRILFYLSLFLISFGFYIKPINIIYLLCLIIAFYGLVKRYEQISFDNYIFITMVITLISYNIVYDELAKMTILIIVMVLFNNSITRHQIFFSICTTTCLLSGIKSVITQNVKLALYEHYFSILPAYTAMFDDIPTPQSLPVIYFIYLIVVIYIIIRILILYYSINVLRFILNVNTNTTTNTITNINKSFTADMLYMAFYTYMIRRYIHNSSPISLF